MKKISLLAVVFAALALASCETEQQFDNGNGLNLSEDGIAFVFNTGKVTKATDIRTAPKETGLVFSLGTVSGSEYFLEESVEDMNGFAPETKGSPIYTKNVSQFYKTLDVVTYKDGAPHTAGDATFDYLNGSTQVEVEGRDGWIYSHDYLSSPWPEGEYDKKLDFYLSMPSGILSSASKQKFDGDAGAKGTFSFRYSVPEVATDQNDILFGYTALSRNEYYANYTKTGAPVTFYHALTGIKFRSDNNNSNATKTIITAVEFIGLKEVGTCSIDALNNTVTWSNLSDTTTITSFSTTFNNPTYTPSSGANNSDGTVAYTTDDEYFGGTSFVAGGDNDNAANKQNLNDAEGTKTFWLIPHNFRELYSAEEAAQIKLKVTFRVKTPDTPNGTQITHTIQDFGTQLWNASVNWKAGQLRTYVLHPIDIDVEIMDEMTETTKSNLHIANTGNADEYVRMLVIGNWYGWKPGTTQAQMESTEPSILVGYESVTGSEMVKPWYSGGYDGVDPYGSFDDNFALGKLGDRDGKRNDWADASGGYYFTMPIGPGEGSIDLEELSATADLFDHYTVTNVPTIYLPVGNTRQPAVGVHLVMEIVIQAIAVPKDPDTGENIWWLQAWYDATGIDKLDPDATRNAKFKNLYTRGEYDPVYHGN